MADLARAPLLLIALAALAAPAHARSLELVGNAGQLGEWELNATVTASGSDVSEFWGPLTMTHIGLCTQDGPERKTGEIRVQMSGSPPRLRASLRVDGVECTYSATLSSSYSGLMSCPDRRAVPLILWVR
jgi:hypothetical protein